MDWGLGSAWRASAYQQWPYMYVRQRNQDDVCRIRTPEAWGFLQMKAMQAGILSC